MAQKLFLPGLNGLRAIAAISVAISHINGHLYLFSLTNFRYLDLANFGVTIFFTISGFLITYLLLKENQKYKTVDYKKFYMRRILRIWPLYYFYLLLILLILGYNDLGITYLLYLGIIPNIANAILADPSITFLAPTPIALFLIGHYWSLGTEEQFYALYPIVITKGKKIFTFLLLFPIIFLFLKIIVNYLNFPMAYRYFLHYSRFGCLCIGGLGAYIYTVYKTRCEMLLYQKLSYYVEFICWGILLLVALNKFHIASIIDHEIIACITVLIIYLQITGRAILNLENKMFDFLGKISYGIYVYNPLTIYLISQYLINPSNSTFTSYSLYIYIIVLFSNIIIAYISYNTLEKYFLNMKHNFTLINSVNNRKDFMNEK